MTLDELIATLQEAKEHFVPGKSKVILCDSHDNYETDIFQVVYDSKCVTINF